MALNQDIDRLSRIPLFATLEIDAIRLLAFSVESRTLAAGDVLFRQGDPADDAFLVVSGRLDLTTTGAAAGSKTAAVAPGALVGETALLRGTERPATAVAGEGTRLMRISRPLFLRVLTEHPRSAVRMRSFLARRLKERLDPAVVADLRE